MRSDRRELGIVVFPGGARLGGIPCPYAAARATWLFRDASLRASGYIPWTARARARTVLFLPMLFHRVARRLIARGSAIRDSYEGTYTDVARLQFK
ncbi:unnamed protein product, partial [Iphiclides podalirius]